jgi:D-alanyl-lipoteichoic acid acyltransferase DltB (MBOAT superfamily)
MGKTSVSYQVGFYAMAIHKNQGQTLEHTGVWLVTAVFGHYQLYVAASRTGACSTVMFAVLPYNPDDPYITVNLVYRHIPIGLYYLCFTNSKALIYIYTGGTY